MEPRGHSLDRGSSLGALRRNNGPRARSQSSDARRPHRQRMRSGQQNRGEKGIVDRQEARETGEERNRHRRQRSGTGPPRRGENDSCLRGGRRERQWRVRADKESDGISDGHRVDRVDRGGSTVATKNGFTNTGVRGDRRPTIAYDERRVPRSALPVLWRMSFLAVTPCSSS